MAEYVLDRNNILKTYRATSTDGDKTLLSGSTNRLGILIGRRVRGSDWEVRTINSNPPSRTMLSISEVADVLDGIDSVGS